MSGCTSCSRGIPGPARQPWLDLGKIYAEIGLLRTGKVEDCSRSDLVGTYLGETAQKVTAAVNRSLGGILFIDEAYALSPRTEGGDGDLYGAEAIAELVKLMEDHRDELMVIVAGYTDRMEDFLEANPGLKSRFDRTLTFDDYTPLELEAIFDDLCVQNGLTLTDEAKVALRRSLRKMTRPKEFGNGRYVRSLFEQSLKRQSDRLLTLSNRSVAELSTIEEPDLAFPVLASPRRATTSLTPWPSWIL